jgi:CelD/BcsL family acetyltransferase involved in cellulose biosynthesis
MVDRGTLLLPSELIDVLAAHAVFRELVEQRAIRLRSLHVSDHLTANEFSGEVRRLVQMIHEANDVLATRLADAPELWA